MSEATTRESLEAEREFLMRSLDDLDAERAEQNIDDATYDRLRADYTARTARVLRALDGEQPALAEMAADRPAVRPTARRLMSAVAVVVFVGIVGVALAYGLGARLPGQTITGRQNPTGPDAAQQLRNLRADVANRPEDPRAHLDLARALMATDPAGALAEFRSAAQLDPTNPEPFAYSGWLIRLQGFPDDGLTLIDKAIQLREDYPDARFFKGLILLRDRQDPEAAVGEFQRYLVVAPDSPLADQVRTLLADAVEASASTPTSPTTSSP